jgi:nitroreductase
MQSPATPYIENESMETRNPVKHPVISAVGERWSPYVYDPGRDVSVEDLESLFEAARWAMSAFNAQPWRYIVGVRGRSQEAWEGVHASLLAGNQGWTKDAPVLALGLAERNFEHNGKPNKTAFHDLGAASATLSYEAASRGLAVHQMSGIDPEKARENFSLPATLEPFTGLAIGYPGDPAGADQEFAGRDQRVRERKPLGELIIRGGF